MAVNFLKVTKEDNEQFSFVLNSDLATEIINTRNDLFTVGTECHFKTADGSNIIKEQNVIYSNVSLFNGASPISAPTSVRDLFDKLTALGYFDWMVGSGGGSATRFTDLLDTFQYFGKAGQFVVVSDDELQLISKVVTIVENSTELNDMPATIEPNKILVGNATGTAYIQIDAPAGANAYLTAFTYTSPDPQEFTLSSGAKVIAVMYNSGFLNPLTDWIQTGNVLTINPTVTLVDNDIITPIAVI